MIMRTTSSKTAVFVAVLACALALVAACSDEPPAESASRGLAAPAAAGAAAAAAGQKKEAEALVFKDDDFVESEHNRDPFRSYASAFRSHGVADAAEGNTQRPVIMPTTAVESMRLIAIIGGMPRPKAMLVDLSGVGYVVERGDYIGRAKVLQTTGSVSMTLNWRIDRIRENEVVLTRADPTDPTRPPLTRIISMRDELAKAD